MNRIAIVGEFSPTFPPHVATNAAIRHAVDALGVAVTGEWVSTSDLDPSLFDRCSGIWVAPGSPYKDLERTLSAIRRAREEEIPCLGTCGGFQHMVLEYGRNVLGFKDAQHAEYDPYASELFVTQLACSLAGRELPLTFAGDSRVARAYDALSAIEEYYCNFGVHPDKVAMLKSGDLQVTGWDPEGDVRVIELPRHPFYLGTLYVPQTRSRPDRPHPLVAAFVAATAAESPRTRATTAARYAKKLA